MGMSHALKSFNLNQKKEENREKTHMQPLDLEVISSACIPTSIIEVEDKGFAPY